MNKDFTLNGLDFSPEINLARYLQSIRKFPILTPENEYDLAVKYKATHDPKISQQLINSHLRLVVKVVSKYKGYGLPVSEMISEGNIGLLYAINKFEPEKGFRFSTYALWWIKASIQKYILNSWSLVKIGTTAAQKKLFFNLFTDSFSVIRDGNIQILRVPVYLYGDYAAAGLLLSIHRVGQQIRQHLDQIVDIAAQGYRFRMVIDHFQPALSRYQLMAHEQHTALCHFLDCKNRVLGGNRIGSLSLDGCDDI